jgi:hypothetical protein
MTPERILHDVTTAREALASLVVHATKLTHQIARQREGLKTIEDGIVAEIWNNPAYKNDKARNEQKHLARINDTRYTEVADNILTLEAAKAQCHADILTCQNEMQIATIQYQAAMIGTVAGAQVSMQATEKTNADTTKSVDVKPATEVAAASPVDSTAGKEPSDIPYLPPSDEKKPEKVGNIRI